MVGLFKMFSKGKPCFQALKGDNSAFLKIHIFLAFQLQEAHSFWVHFFSDLEHYILLL